SGILLSGCATTRSPSLVEQGLRNEISALESQLQAKENEIASLKEALDTMQERESGNKGFIYEKAQIQPSTMQIQTALLNAGFDPGQLDGRMGKKTREAIRQFQREHNLNPDGKVGKKTWAALKEFLEKKLK
ncbi:MAG: peptidoglycan-binding protein, partial [Candidatus Omnitrophica bacterium]|nr:peptidoglycan-binding protein [Candidatus Omnitrophota bacterium]